MHGLNGGRGWREKEKEDEFVEEVREKERMEEGRGRRDGGRKRGVEGERGRVIGGRGAWRMGQNRKGQKREE